MLLRFLKRSPVDISGRWYGLFRYDKVPMKTVPTAVAQAMFTYTFLMHVNQHVDSVAGTIQDETAAMNILSEAFNWGPATFSGHVAANVLKFVKKYDNHPALIVEYDGKVNQKGIKGRWRGRQGKHVYTGWWMASRDPLPDFRSEVLNSMREVYGDYPEEELIRRVRERMAPTERTTVQGGQPILREDHASATSAGDTPRTRDDPRDVG